MLRQTWLSSVLGVTFCCLLLLQQQCPVSAEPRPDFAVDFALYGTSRVQSAINGNLAEANILNTNLEVVLLSRYPLLGVLASLVQRIGASLLSDVQELAALLNPLVYSNDSEEFGRFDQLLARIQSLVDSVDGFLASIAEQLAQFPNTCLLAQLTDQLLCIRRALQDLYDALAKLKNAIRPLLGSEESSEEDERSCRNIPDRYVYQVAYALRALRALLPVVGFTLSTTVANIRTADAYLVRLTSEAGEAQSVDQYLALIDATYVHTAVRGRINATLLTGPTGLAAERSAVNLLSNLPPNSLRAITAALTTFETSLRPGSNAELAFRAALVEIQSNLATILTDIEIPRIDNSQVVRELILLLLSGCAHGRYCFYKYSELLFNLAGTGVSGVERCINRERDRLDYLRDTLLRQVAALAYDYEDIAEELAVCNQLPERNDRNRCVRSVSPSYTALANNYASKFQNLLATGTSEAVAAKHRLAACVRVLQANIIDGSLDELLDEIRNCRVNGPTETPPPLAAPAQ